MKNIENIKISVVIPYYNREQTIVRCVDSVKAQTFQAYEIIIADDCSTDNAEKLVSGLDEKVKYFRLNENRGAQAARNLGIKSATGNWIAFLDSDDEWLPDKLEEQVNALARYDYNPYTLIHTGGLQVFDEKTILMPINNISGNNAYKLLLKGSSPVFPTLLVSKQALVDIGYLDENVPSYQEWDTAIQLAKICRFVFINKPLFMYHMHHMETISKDKAREICGYQYIIDKFEKEIIEYCGSQAMDNHLMVLISKSASYGMEGNIAEYSNRIKNKGLNIFSINIFLFFGLKISLMQRLKNKFKMFLKYIKLYPVVQKIKYALKGY